MTKSRKITVYVVRFARFIRKNGKAVRLVTAGRLQYYVYRYEGSLNGIDDAVVVTSFPRTGVKAFREKGSCAGYGTDRKKDLQGYSRSRKRVHGL